MKRLSIVLWAIAIALLYNAGLYAIDSAWALTPFSVVLMIIVLAQIETMREAFLFFLIFFPTLFALHLTWGLMLLVTTSHISMINSVVIYAAFVWYCSLIAMLIIAVPMSVMVGVVYTAITSRVLRAGVLCMMLWASYRVWEQYALFLLDSEIHYRFLNPLLAVAYHRYRSDHRVLSKKGDRLVIGDTTLVVCHLEPDTIIDYTYPEVAVFRIHQKLATLNLAHKEGERAENIVVFGPETTCAFPVNEYADYVKLWSSSLPPKSIICLGGARSVEEKNIMGTLKKDRFFHQSLFFIRNGRISACYDKSLLTPCYERLPRSPLLKENFNIASLLLTPPFFATPPCREGATFTIESTPHPVRIVPIMCSEAFLSTSRFDSLLRTIGATEQTPALPVLFVNDSWFIEPFKKWMKALAWSDARRHNRSILYVSHSSFELFCVAQADFF